MEMNLGDFGCICGILLVCAASVFLLWKEGKTVRRAQVLVEAGSKCRPLTNTDLVFDSNNGHLVHLTGPLTTDKPLEDQEFGVIVEAVRLRRVVEMYQWVEYCYAEINRRGKMKRIEAHYDMEWKTELVDSSLFLESPYCNPSSFPINQKEWKALQTTIGSFRLSPALVDLVSDLVSDWQPVQLSLTHEMNLKRVQVYENYIYISCQPWSPAIGDLRIKYEFAGMSDPANPIHVSIIACQSLGRQLTTYYSAGLGEGLLLLHFGVKSHEEMLKKEYRSNVIATWLYRGIGWCANFIGFLILTYLCLDIPVIQENYRLANALLASSLTLVSITIGWL